MYMSTLNNSYPRHATSSRVVATPPRTTKDSRAGVNPLTDAV